MADKEVATYESVGTGASQEKPPAFQLATSLTSKAKQQQDTKSTANNSGAGGFYSLNVAQKGKLILPTALWILLVIAGICFLTLLASSINSIGAIDELVELEQEKLNKLDQLERELDKLETNLNHNQHHHMHNSKRHESKQIVDERLRQPELDRMDSAALKFLSQTEGDMKEMLDDSITKSIPWLSFSSLTSLGQQQPAKPSSQVKTIHRHSNRVPSPPPSVMMMMQQLDQLRPPFGRPKSPFEALVNDQPMEPVSGIIVSSSSVDGGLPSVNQLILEGSDSLPTNKNDDVPNLPHFLSSFLNGLGPAMFAGAGNHNNNDHQEQINPREKHHHRHHEAQAPMISARIGKINININSPLAATEQDNHESQPKYRKKPKHGEQEISSLESSVDDLVSKLMMEQRQQQQGPDFPKISIIDGSGPMVPEHNLRGEQPLSPLASLLVPFEQQQSSKHKNDHHWKNPSLGSHIASSHDSNPIIFTIDGDDDVNQQQMLSLLPQILPLPMQSSNHKHHHSGDELLPQGMSSTHRPSFGQSPYENMPVIEFDAKPAKPSEAPWNLLADDMAGSLMQNFLVQDAHKSHQGPKSKDNDEPLSVVLIKGETNGGGDESAKKKEANDILEGFKVHSNEGNLFDQMLRLHPDSKLVVAGNEADKQQTNDPKIPGENQQQTPTKPPPTSSSDGHTVLSTAQAPSSESEQQSANGSTTVATLNPISVPTTTSQIVGLDDDVRKEFESLIGNIFTLPQSSGQSSPQRVDAGSSSGSGERGGSSSSSRDNSSKESMICECRKQPPSSSSSSSGGARSPSVGLSGGGSGGSRDSSSGGGGSSSSPTSSSSRPSSGGSGSSGGGSSSSSSGRSGSSSSESGGSSGAGSSRGSSSSSGSEGPLNPIGYIPMDGAANRQPPMAFATIFKSQDDVEQVFVSASQESDRGDSSSTRQVNGPGSPVRQETAATVTTTTTTSPSTITESSNKIESKSSESGSWRTNSGETLATLFGDPELASHPSSPTVSTASDPGTNNHTMTVTWVSEPASTEQKTSEPDSTTTAATKDDPFLIPDFSKETSSVPLGVVSTSPTPSPPQPPTSVITTTPSPRESQSTSPLPTTRRSDDPATSPTINPSETKKKPVRSFLEKADDFIERNIMNFRKFF